MLAGSFLAGLGTLGILTVLVLYPLSLILRPHRKKEPPSDPEVWPTVTLITGAHNAAAVLPAKLANFHEFDYPAECLTQLIASDASTDDTRQVVESAADPRIRLVEQKERLGKASAMNQAVLQTDADLLLFSDADSRLAPDAVRKLARHFSDPQVGGVCGYRRTVRGGAWARDAQQTYININCALKKIESAQGRISGNDGTIHMIRRSLYTPIPADASDDLYTLLAVISQGYRFLFDPQALSEAKVPSQSVRHEIQRRRRIVTRSLTAMCRMRQLLNPRRFGWVSVGLLINKIGRRLLPFFLLLLGAGLLWTAFASSAAAPIGFGLTGILLLVAGVWLVATLLRFDRLLKPMRVAGYILVGLAGTALGVLDFVSGRRVSGWTPRRTGKGAE